MLAQDIFDKLEGLGAAALFVLAVLYMVFHHLRKGNTQEATNNEVIQALDDRYNLLLKRFDEMTIILVALQIKQGDCHKWLAVEDPVTGSKKIYVQSSLEASIVKLNDNIGEQTKLLAQMVSEMKAMRQGR